VSGTVLKQSERQFEQAVVDLSKLHKWMSFHPYDSRRSEPGFPDRVFVRPPRLLIVEFKTDTGRVRPDQRRWMDALRACGLDVRVWRPRDWPFIEGELA
jgi:hypothetical protein